VSGETGWLAGVCAATLVATSAAMAANIVVIVFTKNLPQSPEHLTCPPPDAKAQVAFPGRF
jgi:hypothetical protein